MTLLDNIKAAVQLDPNGIPLGYGKQPTRVGTKPWVVAWPDAGTVYAATMKWNDGRDLTITFRCYGLTPESAAVAVRRVESAAYAQAYTTVDGRHIQYPEQLTAVPLAREDEADPPTYVYVVEWKFRSTPA